jgi:colanic acid biosynthesis glycosyl transferase WcaI
MRVLIPTPYYPPDLGSCAEHYGMLAEELVRLGYEVSVISAVPHYPTGRVPAEFRGRLFHREQRNGVRVTRVWVPSIDRARLAARALTFVCYQVLASLVGLRLKYDVVITSNPALEVFLPFLVLSVIRRKACIFSVHEIYPDIGVKLGIFRHRPVIKAIDWMERFCFWRSSYVRVLSEGYKRALETRGIAESKLAVICNWTDTDFIRPLPRRNAFSAQWGLDEFFVVMYAGNWGVTQGLEQIVEAARFLIDEPAIRCVLVGDGVARNELQQIVQREGLNNVRFIPFQQRELVPQILASADVSLITLKRGMGTDSVPAKFFPILASARPVIATMDAGTDTWNFVHQSECGVCVEPENSQALAGAILRLYRDEDLRERFAANGRNYVVKFHSRASAAQEFHKLLLSLSPEREASLPEAVARELRGGPRARGSEPEAH